MATVYWRGGATAVAQVSTGSIDSLDATPANNTFTVAIGSVSISVAGVTDVATTATALRAALNASTHPYFSGITWSGSGGNITGTADTAGVPFVPALTETGAGTGAVTDFSTTTASAGPADWSTAANWSAGAIPANDDAVVFRQTSAPVAWGLSTGLTGINLTVEDTYTGTIGLRTGVFATSADGATTVSTVSEYRTSYLTLDADVIDIGQQLGLTSAGGSGRVKINNTRGSASILTVHKTAGAPTDTGLPAVRYRAAHADADVYVRSAQGGVGIAVDVPGETSTVGDLYVSDQTDVSQVILGTGVTITNWTQNGGRNILQAAATVTAVTVAGGTLTTEGDYTVTTLAVRDGTCYCNHVKTGGNAITTANVTGGTLDGSQSSFARTWATVNPDGGTIIADDGVVTITTLDAPAGLRSLTVAEV